jgi:hypothetical protein
METVFATAVEIAQALRGSVVPIPVMMLRTAKTPWLPVPFKRDQIEPARTAKSV